MGAYALVYCGIELCVSSCRYIAARLSWREQSIKLARHVLGHFSALKSRTWALHSLLLYAVTA